MKTWTPMWILLGWLGLAPGAHAQLSLDMRWDPGAEECDASRQRTQPHAIDEYTIAIRQNPCVDFEAPILYLLIGSERALLIDSGVSEDPRLTAELTGLVSGYLRKADGSRLPLVVAHSHGHQDHRAGDAAFAALPDTVVVPVDSLAMRDFFGLREWPEGGVRFDLGNRIVEVVPTPGHHEDHVVFIDGRTRLLFSGDFVLPGRLLVQDIDAYIQSARRLLEPVNAVGVTHALGAHVEMNSAGELYAGGATFHPDERPAAMPFGAQQVAALRKALEDFNGFYSRHASYAIVNPVRNLIALATGVIVVLALLVWLVRRWRRRVRARRAAVTT